MAVNLLLEEAQKIKACTFWFISLVVLQFFFPFGLTYSVTIGGYAFTNVCICID